MAVGVVSPCNPGLTSPAATSCSGYFDGNLLNNSKKGIDGQTDGVAALPSAFTFDGDWGKLDPAFKVEGLSKDGIIDFGKTLFGETIVGAHFGNVAGPAGNVTVFWQFDFGTTGAKGITLTDTQGFSNSVLYTTGASAVPETATWLMLIAGMGFVGGALRSSRRSRPLTVA